MQKVNVVIDETLKINNLFSRIYIHPFFKDIKKGSVLNYHWNDYVKFKKDYLYIRQLKSDLIISVSKFLNKFHGKNYSRRFWEIEIGTWIHSYCSMMFDRWEILSKLNKVNLNFLISLKKFEEKDMILQTIDEFNNIQYTTDYSSYLFSIIINHRFLLDNKYSVEYHQDYPHQIYDIRKKFNLISKSPKKKILDFYNFLLSKKLKKQEYAFIRTYLGTKDEFKLNLIFFQLPTFVPNNYFICEPDLVLRNQISLGEIKKNHFENFLYANFFKFIPINYLEGFKIIEKKIQDMSIPQSPKKIFSSNILYKSLLSRYCAEKTEQGAELILATHGGCYGHYDIHFAESQELSVSDLYLTWGWNKKNDHKVKPFGIIRSLNRLRNKVKDENKKILLMLIPALPVFQSNMESHIPFIHNNQFIFNPCFKIIDNLSEKIKLNNLTVRFYERNFGVNEFETFHKKYPHIKKDNQKYNFRRILSKTRILLSPYLGTGYLETLAMNIPTIVFNSKNNSNLIREDAIKFYEVLKDAKVFFDDEVSLSEHINSIWNNTSVWWNSNKVQEAINFFCKEYACINKTKLQDLKKIFLN
jgi:putative transferase (TIGR04331 family)